ncbi:putative codeine 3-O-demethylase [Dioscorea sansibarensis]
MLDEDWLRYPVDNIFGLNDLNWRTVLDKYASELERVAGVLLGSLANNLGTEQVADMFKGGLQTVRIDYYPPCHLANKVLGLSPHSDAGGLTLLLQVNEVEGLQIKKNG